MQTPKHAKKIRVSVAPDAASTHQFCFSRCGDPKTNEPRPEARSRRREKKLRTGDSELPTVLPGFARPWVGSRRFVLEPAEPLLADGLF